MPGEEEPETGGVPALRLPDQLGIRRRGRDDTAPSDSPDKSRFNPDHEDRLIVAKVTPDGLYGDILAAVGFLCSPAGGAATSAVSLGFCMGGRFAFLTAAPRFGLDGVIGFYGYPDALFGAPGPTQRAAELTAPILGLFGGADEGVPSEIVAAFGKALTDAGAEHEFVAYPGAPHGFFDQGLAGHEEACADAWRRVVGFLAARGGGR